LKKKFILLVLVILLSVSAFISCAKSASGKDNTSKEGNLNGDNGNASVAEETTEDIYADNLPEQDFGGAEFRMAVQDAAWLYVLYDAQEQTGDVLNDAVYKRNREIEDRFNVKITQNAIDPVGTLKKNVQSGVDAYELYLPVDRDALNLAVANMICKLSDIPNINIAKPYWSQSLNKSLTIGGNLYFAYGSFNLSVYDYTHVLLFNKQMISDLGLDSPYNLVNSGNWTFDTYSEMAKAAVKDVDGNGVMDGSDIYGLISLDKHVLPDFWIAAGVQSISKSSDDIPQFTLMGDEKFASVISKIFTITYDNNSWYRGGLAANKEDYYMSHTLFYDDTFKMVGDLRGSDTDFGIIPYPKYTADQENYYTRVEGGNPGVVPVTAKNLQMIGTVLEALNAESAKTVVPAYYDISLKTKYARDEESSQMLDLIFNNRIYDLGDTYWSSILRDGMFLNMFKKNDRDLASQLEAVEPKINAEIDKVVSAFEDMNNAAK